MFDFENQLAEQESGIRPEEQARMAVSASASLYDHPSEADRYQMIRTYFQMLIEEELPMLSAK